MTSIQFLEVKLKELFAMFPQGNIRYEYRVNRRSHIIEITPVNLYNNNNYKNAELSLEEEFELKFPEENIIFVSDGSLNKVANPTLELLSEQKLTVCFILDKQNLDQVFMGSVDEQYCGENNYALAA